MGSRPYTQPRPRQHNAHAELFYRLRALKRTQRAPPAMPPAIAD